ncbi:MAG: hypothetical protein ABI624_18745, partial [Casimicrobiaceae bacterium]
MFTAIHEAGHAVAAIDLGVYIDGVSIVRDETTLGRVGVEDGGEFFVPAGMDPAPPECDALYRKWADDQATIDSAGHAAVVGLLKHGDMGHRSAIQNGALDDYANARERLGKRRRRIATANARAVEIVQRRGDDIRKIAELLARHD